MCSGSTRACRSCCRARQRRLGFIARMPPRCSTVGQRSSSCSAELLGCFLSARIWMVSEVEILPDGNAPVLSLTPSANAPIPVRRLLWRNAVRIIPSVFPPVNLFERVAQPEDIDAVQAIESAYNPRLRDAVGDLSLVPRDERVVG